MVSGSARTCAQINQWVGCSAPHRNATRAGLCTGADDAVAQDAQRDARVADVAPEDLVAAHGGEGHGWWSRRRRSLCCCRRGSRLPASQLFPTRPFDVRRPEGVLCDRLEEFIGKSTRHLLAILPWPSQHEDRLRVRALVPQHAQCVLIPLAVVGRVASPTNAVQARNGAAALADVGDGSAVDALRRDARRPPLQQRGALGSRVRRAAAGGACVRGGWAAGRQLRRLATAAICQGDAGPLAHAASFRSAAATLPGRLLRLKEVCGLATDKALRRLRFCKIAWCSSCTI